MLRVRVTIPAFEDKLREAIAHYWRVLVEQAAKQSAGKAADRGRRGGVLGGKQMNGFCTLVRWLLIENGLAEASIHVQRHRQLPGYFRATKDWDMLVVHDRHLVAALEFKSQRGPSFGNNLNNRTEEALGNATDFATAYRERAFGTDRPRPWLGWVMLLEDCPESQEPVTQIKEPHFRVFKEFRNASYAKRYEIMLRRLVLEKMYDGVAFVMSTEKQGLRGDYTEPATDLAMRKFLVSLAGHVATYVASIS